MTGLIVEQGRKRGSGTTCSPLCSGSPFEHSPCPALPFHDVRRGGGLRDSVVQRHLQITIIIGTCYACPPAVLSAAGCSKRVIFKKDATTMADKGKADKGRKEAQKKPALTLKEKRKVKNEKKSSK